MRLHSPIKSVSSRRRAAHRDIDATFTQEHSTHTHRDPVRALLLRDELFIERAFNAARNDAALSSRIEDLSAEVRVRIVFASVVRCTIFRLCGRGFLFSHSNY